MQSRRSESFSGAFRNPTLMAMLGSAGFHGVLVIFSALHPADSQPNHLRIVSIAPPSASTAPQKPGMGLPVPNSLPPINLSKVPQLPPTPDTSAIKIPASMYINPSGSIGRPKITNPPIRSFELPSLVNPGIGNVDRSGSTGVLPPPNVPTENSASPNFTPSSRATPDYSKYAPSKNPDLPKVSQGEFQQSNDLYARSSPSNPSETPLGTGSVDTSEARSKARTWLQAQERRYGQKLSLQAGQSLTADYPIEACASQQQGIARVAAIYGPNGTVATREILESAPSPTLDKAAIAEVDRFRADAAGVYQAFNFTVKVPYSAKVCEAAQPQPSSTQTPSSEASDRPSSTPQPSQAQPSSNPVPQPTFSPVQPSPEPTGMTPAEPIPPDRVQPPPQAPQPQPSETPNPAPSGAAGSPERSFSSPSSEAPSPAPLPSATFTPETPTP